jgi:hypothetical protein
MRSLRLTLTLVVVLALAASAAWAITYDDVFELTARDVAEETIVRLIVDDGRGFELDDDQLADLRAAGVSTTVIDAMLDPEVGRAWLEGDDFGGPAADGDDGGSAVLDRAYVAGAGSTALVYSFGYYEGPLARYYHVDPYYYPFWFAGYPCAYWPSYYAYGWRPYDEAYYPYPYDWYDYDSYYCDAYYDPGYWADLGYTVLPGADHRVSDAGPRYRNGGITPPKGGRTDTVPAIREVVGGRAALRPASDDIARRPALATRVERIQADDLALIREQSERWAREWQEQMNEEARRTAEEVQRRRESPPPAARAEQPRDEKPRAEQPRRERTPPPPPAAPEPKDRGGEGDRGEAGVSRGGAGRGGR